MNFTQTRSSSTLNLYHSQTNRKKQLFEAIACKDLKAIEYFADKETANALNENARTPMAVLIEMAEYTPVTQLNTLVEIGQLLIWAEADLQYQQGTAKKTYLHIAAEYGCAPLCQLLIDFGCDIEAQNFLGSTPIISAAHYKRTRSTIAILAKNYANVRAQTLPDIKQIGCGGLTALHVAFNENKIDNILGLYENRADLDATSACGSTVIECMDSSLIRYFDLAPQLHYIFTDILICRKALYIAKNDQTSPQSISQCENELNTILTRHQILLRDAREKVERKLNALLNQEFESSIIKTLR